jgi:hypothetical protein
MWDKYPRNPLKSRRSRPSIDAALATAGHRMFESNGIGDVSSNEARLQFVGVAVRAASLCYPRASTYLDPLLR